jgi:hypothetical protein
LDLPFPRHSDVVDPLAVLTSGDDDLKTALLIVGADSGIGSSV